MNENCLSYSELKLQPSLLETGKKNLQLTHTFNLQ